MLSYERTGCSAARKRTCMGCKGPSVRIRPPRPLDRHKIRPQDNSGAFAFTLLYQFLYQFTLGVDSLAEHQRGVGMASVVETIASQSSPMDQLIEGSTDGSWKHRLATPITEDKAIIIDFIAQEKPVRPLALPHGPEYQGGRRRERHKTTTFGGLWSMVNGLAALGPIEVPHYRDTTLAQVHISPSEGQCNHGSVDRQRTNTSFARGVSYDEAVGS